MALTIQTYFLRHLQTLVGSLGRLARQPFASFMTIAVIAIALALPLSLELVLQNALNATSTWRNAFEISVYLDKSPSPARSEAIAKQLQQRSDVAAVRVVTAAQALAEFREYSGFGQALDALNDNPLPDTLVVTPSVSVSTPEGTSALKIAIAAIPNVGSVQLDTEWVKRLVALLDLVRSAVRLIGGLLGIGVLLITGNTIRLDIVSRRAEIEVMKLVGATDGFARRPFLWTGVWYGLGGGLLAVALVSLGVAALAGPVARLAALYGSAFRLSGLDWRACGAAILGAALLGWLGSWIAATRYIRAIEPT
ncbi:MAG TPA: permease-like cell division protein FtsX [Steroidobacteraceae bacterium]|nr:permease-like cell division protein FtsX [Steroidobacteraceae bacterium]